MSPDAHNDAPLGCDAGARDRFERLIESCPVMHFEETLSVEVFLRPAAQRLAQDLSQSGGILYRALRQREKESPTVLNPFLAIPHVLIPGEKRFAVLMARGHKGIAFSPEAPAVHAAFVLVGTQDERPFQLALLAAIARLAQDPDFEKRWMAAPDEQALRNVVLQCRRGQP